MDDTKPAKEEYRPTEERQRPGMRKIITVTSYVGLSVLIIAALFVIPSLTAFSPSFCRLCHQSQYAYWMESTHKNITCTDCHIQRNSWDALKARVGMLNKMLIKIQIGQASENIAGFESKPLNTSCDFCHKLKRDITPGGDLVIPHASHTKLRKLNCIDCHRQLVHSAASKTGNKPAMVGCYKCHDGTKAPNQCSACHTEKALPQDHRSSDWLRIHNLVQKQNPAYCEGCHGWVQDYCKECHKRKPRSHDKTWPASHQGLIATDRRDGCAKCHGIGQCQGCHTRRPKVTRPKGY